MLQKEDLLYRSVRLCTNRNQMKIFSLADLLKILSPSSLSIVGVRTYKNFGIAARATN